jgi:signal transduction histidine kinase
MRRVDLTRQNVFVRYSAAILLVTASLLVTLLLWRVVQAPATPLFLVAIIITAWFVGRGPAVLATLLSALTIDYVFITPQYQLSGSLDDIGRIFVFSIEGITLSLLIVSRRRTSDQVRESREELRALSTHLQTIIERERTRIAREIHDELGQELTSLKFDVAWLKERAAGANKLVEIEKLTSILKNIDGAISSVRRIATELRPAVLDTLGLTAAIEWQAKDFQDRTGIKCKLNSMEEDIQLNDETATTVFRIFQESLTNVARHANATEVGVGVDRIDGRLIMQIEDNGKGLDPSTIHRRYSLGIIGMQERVRLLNGELTIEGREGSGTIVHVEVPIANGATSASQGAK